MGHMTSASGGGTPTKTEDADANTKVQVEESADENKIRFDTAGTERMIIDNAGKVGIGTSSPKADLHLVTTGNDATLDLLTDNEVDGVGGLLIESTASHGAQAAPMIAFYRNGANSQAAGDLMANVLFMGEDDGDAPTIYGQWKTWTIKSANGQESYAMAIQGMVGGTNRGFIHCLGAVDSGSVGDDYGGLLGPEVVINQNAQNIDFRVESTASAAGGSAAAALFTEGSSGNVGIGTSTPGVTLDVIGNARFRAAVEVCTSDPAPANTETGTIYQFTKGSAGVFTLPASPPVGTQFVLVNGSANDIVITRPHSSVKINGATSNATNTTAYAATSIVAVVSNGDNSEWLVFGGI
jgi:hypothetical protein